MDIRAQNNLLNFCRHPRFRDARAKDTPKPPRSENVNIDGDVLGFIPNEFNKVGVYISANQLTKEDNYFEVEILETGSLGAIGVGLVPYQYRLDIQPGWSDYSIGFHADDGKLFKAHGLGKPFGPTSNAGDIIGCGIKFDGAEDDRIGHTVQVFFTKNRKEVGTSHILMPPGGLYPAIGMHSEGEEVRFIPDAEWHPVDLMAVDTGEEEWSRLHDVRLNGSILEYTGRGKRICDVGLAQARCPLDTRFHYFEIEIIDPGENCFIAIGIARRDYPRRRHPGWNRGSVAYHADDGKIFVGSGIGDPFGPRCHKGDVMGCGILFPCDYNNELDSEGCSPDESDDYNPFDLDNVCASDEDDDDWGKAAADDNNAGIKVQAFFTRNGKVIGQKEASLPKDGFYPTVGMLSCSEKVKVDLRPLTG